MLFIYLRFKALLRQKMNSQVHFLQMLGFALFLVE